MPTISIYPSGYYFCDGVFQCSGESFDDDVDSLVCPNCSSYERDNCHVSLNDCRADAKKYKKITKEVFL